MNFGYPQMKLPPVPIPTANPTWTFTPGILTDEVLTNLRAKAYDRKDTAQKPIELIVSALGFIAANMQQHLPMVGEMFINTVKDLNNRVGEVCLNEYSTLDYLTGKGPLGSYIADNIEMFKLCSKVHRIEGEYIHHSETQVNMEYEYNCIFNYGPMPVATNGKTCDEYDYLTRLVKRIHEFAWITKPHENIDFKDLWFDQSLHVDSGEFISDYGIIEKSGIYNRSSGFGKTRNALVLIAPIRDTKVALVFDLYSQHSSLQRLYYKPRAENVWVRSADQSGSWMLEGTYDALYKEAESFMTKLGHQLEPDLQPYADNCLMHLNRVSEVVDKLAEIGCANSITSAFKQFELVNSGLGNFSIMHNKVKYTFCKLLGEDPKYRLNIERILSSFGSREDCFSDTVIYDGGEVKTRLVDSFLTTTYLVQELSKFLDTSAAKVEELYQLALLSPTVTS